MLLNAIEEKHNKQKRLQVILYYVCVDNAYINSLKKSVVRKYTKRFSVIIFEMLGLWVIFKIKYLHFGFIFWKTNSLKWVLFVYLEKNIVYAIWLA